MGIQFKFAIGCSLIIHIARLQEGGEVNVITKEPSTHSWIAQL